ncbi:hypothetical protein JW905_00245 [bacterium]|nr:hypothetical protein [candidate division CSSED10-310 bacterium]
MCIGWLRQWKYEALVGLVTVLTAAGIGYGRMRHEEGNEAPEPVRDDSCMTMGLLVRDCPTEIAGLVRVGDPYLFKGEIMARITEMKRRPAEILIAVADGLIPVIDGHTCDLNLRISIQRWIDRVGRFQYGQRIEYETPDYALPAIIVDLPADRAPGGDHLKIRASVLARSVPAPVVGGLYPGAYGMDESGVVELVLTSAAAVEPGSGLGGILAPEIQAAGGTSAPVALRLRGGAYQDYRLTFLLQPRLEDGIPRYHGQALKPGRTYRWVLRRLTIEGELLALEPGADGD